MKKYTVYFEIFGKKMKYETTAESMTNAKQKVIDKIIWHKIVNNEDSDFDKIISKLNECQNIITGQSIK